MTTTEPTTLRHRVGDCPACRSGLWADVQVVVEVHASVLDSDGKARVYAHPRFMGMALHHLCVRDEDDEWTYATNPTSNGDPA